MAEDHIANLSRSQQQTINQTCCRTALAELYMSDAISSALSVVWSIIDNVPPTVNYTSISPWGSVTYIKALGPSPCYFPYIWGGWSHVWHVVIGGCRTCDRARDHPIAAPVIRGDYRGWSDVKPSVSSLYNCSSGARHKYCVEFLIQSYWSDAPENMKAELSIPPCPSSQQLSNTLWSSTPHHIQDLCVRSDNRSIPHLHPEAKTLPHNSHSWWFGTIVSILPIIHKLNSLDSRLLDFLPTLLHCSKLPEQKRHFSCWCAQFRECSALDSEVSGLHRFSASRHRQDVLHFLTAAETLIVTRN